MTGPNHTDHDPRELIWNDGVVLVALPDAQSSEQEKVKIAAQPTDIAPAILELLSQAETIPATELVKHRRESLHFLVEIEPVVQ